tara:strand:- start:1559 stop:2497 length:939 start_codon:yes stop_codon:yes gene_type:complete
MEFNKIYKPERFDKFTIVPNNIFRHKNISAGATGLYCWLFSHDQKTDITVQFICGHFKEGKDAINKKIKELINEGFLIREDVRLRGKFSGYNYFLNEKPNKYNGFTAAVKTGAGKTVNGKTAAVNPQQSNTNNNTITNNKEILNKKYKTTKSKTPIYNQIILKAFPHFVALFPDAYKPKSKAQENKWLDCLDKIQRLDNYDLREVYEVAKDLRNDEFWQNNFLSILKFRNKDKNDIKYIDRFMSVKRQKTKPNGFKKVKGLINYFIYESPANGLKEIGAKTKGGEIFEFHIKQLMSTAEFHELKDYIQAGNN